MNRTFLAGLTGLLLLNSPSAFAAAEKPPRQSAMETLPTAASFVRVNSTNQSFDFFRPWAKKNSFLRKGLGVVLSGNQILVTAELVANRTYVELEKPSSAEKSSAEVVVVDYDCNLALLKPVDPAFLKDAVPLELDSGARVGDRVSIIQLESNGTVAQTPATITTIMVMPYPMNFLALLTYRLSAPLQSREGSFTIPAVRDGRLLGLLMRYDSRSQTADLIPAPVIGHFLSLTAKAEYPGFPRAGVSFASTRDPQLRRYIGLNEDGGVYITQVQPGGAAEKAGFRKGDVILAIQDKPIDQDGNYDSPEYGKIAFSNLTNTQARVGDTLEVTILREGKRQKLPLKLETFDKSKVISEPYMFDRQPRYYVLGGLVFQELSRPYLQEWGGSWPKDAPQRLVYLDAYQDELDKDRGKIVFLSQVLPSSNTLGYENLQQLVVKKVNDIPINRLNDIARAIASSKDGFIKIEFEDDPGVIYLDAKEVENSKAQLMQDYGIPSLENLD